MYDLTGKTIGQYQLVELIDEGGSAWVFKAFQPSMNRYVAVKVLKPVIANEPGAVQQFIKQSEVIAKLQHRGILPIYDVAQDGGTVYRVTSFVETGTLRDHLFEYRDPRQALSLISGLTETLEFIYGEGYIHGNLKPSNIFLDAEKKPVLTDFGLPHPPDEAPTPYMSPEQVQGGVVDRRTDVYALGVLLYTMLAGESPPPGAVVTLQSKRPDIPQSVEQVILKAMAQNPDARFQNSVEFRNALDTALRPMAAQAPPAPSTPPPQPTPAQPEKRTNWLAIVVGILVVLVLCLGAFIFFPGLRDLLPGGAPLPSETPAIETEAPPVATEAPPEATEVPPEDTQVPPSETPPGDEPQPTQLPPEWLEGICGNISLFGGAVFLGIGYGFLKKRRNRSSIT